jgi:hypothetical protein
MTQKKILISAIFFIASFSFILAATPARSQTPSTYFGMNTGRLPASQPWPSVPLGTIRLWDTGTTWNDVEPSRNEYDWTNLDHYLSVAEAHNADVLYTLGGTAEWASSNASTGCRLSPGSCYAPANIQDWDNYVSAVVAHAGSKIKYWEIWNEANLAPYWSGSMPSLVLLAEHAYRIIKAANPNAKVLSPSSSGAAVIVEAFLNSYFAAGGTPFTDIVAFHGYVGSIPEGIVYLETKIRLAMTAHGIASAPIWDTEGGWGQDSTLTNVAERPGYMAREILLQNSSGVARIYWYEWNSATWGTLWTPSGIQPSGVAYGQLYHWMEGATMANACVMAADSTWTCTLTRPGGVESLAIWNAAGTKNYTPASNYKSYMDLAGKSHSINGTVSIGYTPILLVASAPPAAPTGLVAVIH